ncbi:hypothetical protein QAD02_006785 [Eretmocerus hayati]|uniref:Uncharacterized protein n=1 Tax=Eretmocerus hayati TaxID=131215 RepID=A0ACC2N1W2_9HYME|nr:hypothetical protein QAD02_006785 [Eretmocerus hayati]
MIVNFSIALVIWCIVHRASALTNQEKRWAHFYAALTGRISIGLIYTQEDFEFHRERLDTRSFRERVDYYSVVKNDPQRKTKEERGKQLNKVLQCMHASVLGSVGFWILYNENEELRRYYQEALSAYYKSIQNRLSSKLLVRWPHISCDVDKEQLIMMSEVYRDDYRVEIIANQEDGKDSEVNYEEIIEFKPSYYERSSHKYGFKLAKHIDVSFLADDVSDEIRTEIRRRIKERLIQGSRNRVPSTHHMVSVERLSIFGNHYSVLRTNIQNSLSSAGKILTKRKLDNTQFFWKGQSTTIFPPGNGLPVDQHYLQLSVRDIVQPAGNLFFGPDPQLRAGDNKHNFDTEAELIWSPKEYKMLSKLDSKLITLLDRYKIADTRKKMDLARGSKSNNEDLTVSEKLKVIEDSVAEISSGKTDDEIKIIFEDFSSMFEEISKTFAVIRFTRRLESSEPLPFNPTLWDVSSANRWSILTIEEVDSNIMNEALPGWLQDIVYSVGNDTETEIPLKFEPRNDHVEIKNIEFPAPSTIGLQSLASLTAEEIHCINPFTGTPLIKMPVRKMVKMILDKDFDRAAKEFYQQASTSSAVPDIADFVMKELEKYPRSNVEIYSIQNDVCEEIIGKMFPEGLPFEMEEPISMATPPPSDDESPRLNDESIDLAIRLSMLSLCAEQSRRRAVRQITTESMKQKDLVCSKYFGCQIPFQKCIHASNSPCPIKDLIDSQLFNSISESNEIEFYSSAFAMILQEAENRGYIHGRKLSITDIQNYAYENAKNASSVVHGILSEICGITHQFDSHFYMDRLRGEYMRSCDISISESLWDRSFIDFIGSE